MLSLHSKIVWFSVSSRLFIIGFQTLANLIVPDHDAGVFLSPADPNITISLADRTVDVLLGGFKRWDAQYFLHIAQYGYTYENTLAFFPLYPMLVRIVARLLEYFLCFALNFHSLLLISAVGVNLVCFVRSTLALHRLSLVILKSQKLAYISAICYCMNPASVFFTAPYSESLFAWLSFEGMLRCLEQTTIRFGNIAIVSAIPVGLSMVTRSNGMLNLGFILYFWVQNSFQKMIPEIINRYRTLKSKYVAPFLLLPFLTTFIQISITLAVSFVPYVLAQMYNYNKFCTKHASTLPAFLVEFAKAQDMVLPGLFKPEVPDWCLNRVPLAYSYVQTQYWDVGFMKYYQVKQIPNFALALPIVLVMLTQSWNFFRQHRSYTLNLGIFVQKHINLNRNRKFRINYSPGLFVFVVHGFFLTIFCVVFVHVQVTTRLLCSASPIFYWFCAHLLESKSNKDRPKMNIRTTVIGDNQVINFDFEKIENMYSKWRCFLLTESGKGNEKLLKYYFIGYIIVGTALFSNFYPWT